MSDLFSHEVEMIECNTRCELNSEYMEKMVAEEVNKRSKDLDEFVDGIKSIVFSDTDDLTTAELESCCMKLSLCLYEFETQAEYASIRADISALLRNEKYNYYVLSAKSKDERVTVQKSQAIAQSNVQIETATQMLYSHITKLLNNKKSSAYELLATIKKVLSSRISSMDSAL